MHFRHRWEKLRECYLLDAYQFSGGEDCTAFPVRKCLACGKYQYKYCLGLWRDCEISGRGNGRFLLGVAGFRKGKGLRGKISPKYAGTVELSLVKEEKEEQVERLV